MSTIDKIFEKYNRGDTHGYHAASFIAIDKAGEVLHSSHYGSLKVDGSGPPVTEDSIFWTASMTKIFTAVAVMVVVERGLISLDDYVGKAVPELAEPDILVGFEDGRETDSSEGKGEAYVEESVNALERICDTFRHPLIFEPGEDWAYGPGIDWAGRVVEVLSGQTLGEFIQENICDKLGLTATTFHPENHPEYNERKVELALRDKDGKLNAIPIPFPMPAKDDLGGTGLYSTPREYTKLLATLLAGGGSVLKPESVDQIFMPQLKNNKAMMAKFGRPGSERMNRLLTTGKSVHQGLSVCINLEQVPDGRSSGAVSWGGFPNTFWFIDPKSGICASLFFQMLPPVDEVALKILDEVEAALYLEIGPA